MRLLLDDDMLDDEDAKTGIARRGFFECVVRSAMNGDVLRAARARSMSLGEARSEAMEFRLDVCWLYQNYVESSRLSCY